MQSTHNEIRRLRQFERTLDVLHAQLPAPVREIPEMRLVTQALSGGYFSRRALDDALAADGRPSLNWLSKEEYWDPSEPVPLDIYEVFLKPFDGIRFHPAPGETLRRALVQWRSDSPRLVLPVWYDRPGWNKRFRVRPHPDIYHWLFWELVHNAVTHAAADDSGSTEKSSDGAEVVIETSAERIGQHDCLVIGNLASIEDVANGRFSIGPDWVPLASRQTDTAVHGGLGVVPGVLRDLQLGEIWHRALPVDDRLFAVQFGLHLQGSELGVSERGAT
jgi:hypothetical protein